ncbi:uncharacterized protein LOC110185665 [Drosophila serrata]|uniref:uncharacterized protein LOC110185665 n=1 Tax=Drosophila serrata TaxID=7274 RepID=UPI000A1D0627|nr:uncharacterized protein LOC110185665 [Drosophila serrata]
MRTISTLVFLAALLALVAAEQSSGSKARKESALSKIVPRLLWNLKRGDQESHRNSQQPIIIVQQPSKHSDYDEDRHYHHHRPHYPYYPYYPPPPPPTRPPPPPYPGMEYLNNSGGGPTFLVINPNNMQGIYLPASSSNSSNSTSARRSAFVPSIADLLQGLSLEDLSDGSLFEDDSDVVEAAEDGTVELAAESNGTPSLANDDRDEDLVSEEDIEALDRQSNRGVSPKHLVSILMQDKRRRRIQEVLAGIYMRNYNLNRK